MEKLDRLGWAAGIAFVAYGRAVGVRVSSPEALDRIETLLPPGYQPAASPVVEQIYSLIVGGAGPRPTLRRFTLLYAGPTLLARADTLEEVLGVLETDLQMYVAERARGRLFLHAGVVGWKDRAILFPGRSLSGKTRLAAALVRAGATYYSDEYAVLDSRGRVHPYPTPLSLRRPGWEGPRKVAVETLGGSIGIRPLPVSLVLVTRYRAGGRWRPRRLSPGQAVLALLANTVAARRRPAAALATLRRVVSHALVLRGVRGPAERMVRPILQALPDGGNGRRLAEHAGCRAR